MRTESDMKNVLFFLSCSYLLITKERERVRESKERKKGKGRKIEGEAKMVEK